MAASPSGLTNTKCRAEASLLAVVDIQQRLGDAMPNKVLNRVLQNAALLVRSAELLSVPILCTEQYPEGLGATHPTVAAALPAKVVAIRKTTFSCVGASVFHEALVNAPERRQIVLVGMEAHICVLQTALDLCAADHEVFVVEDAICSRRLENYQNALDRLRAHGVSVVSAESVVFEWLADSKHPHFKAVQALLR
ncbi:MAG: isochorismatase family protein [Gammaproteobacteria bacterium]|nr:isochorismatase family protein [Gammaproteobacteria bacterium]